jgi:hypothetical protein
MRKEMCSKLFRKKKKVAIIKAKKFNYPFEDYIRKLKAREARRLRWN